MRITFLIFYILVFAHYSYAQNEAPLTRILFVFDASNSMNARWQTNPKVKVAIDLLNESLDELQDKPNLQVGLRVYGHQSSISNSAQDCNDTKLEVPIGYNRFEAIKKRIKQLKCQGTTPIARSLEKAASDFSSCGNCRNIIILITDGIEACDEDPCAVSRALQEKQITLKPFIIGIGIDESMIADLECIGNFFDASSEETFADVLNVVITQALNSTTAQVNLLNVNDLPAETNVALTFSNHLTGEVLMNLVHTLNYRGLPDTLFLDPLYRYDIIAHTVPEVRILDQEIIPGIHNILALKTPQGDLEIKMNGRLNEYKTIRAIVRQKDSTQTLSTQPLNEKMRYLIGNYDLEILTLPRTYISDVNIRQNHTTTVEIPEPGTLTFKAQTPGYATILLEEGNKLSFVKSLDANRISETVHLQPGRYRVVYRSQASKETLYSIEKKIEIESGRVSGVAF
jgi:Ca-activated chloride channel family protein